MKHPSRGSVVVITPEIKSGDLEFDSQPRPRIFHLLQWVSISVPEDLYINPQELILRPISIYIYIYIISSVRLKNQLEVYYKQAFDSYVNLPQALTITTSYSTLVSN